MALRMLDSDTCIDAMRERSPGVQRHLERLAPGEAAISAIVAAELWTGVMKSSHPQTAALALRWFLNLVTVLDWPADAVQIYADLRARLEMSGRAIGAMDMLIAAHALYERASLVARNVSEFRRVPGLKIESWTVR